MAKVERYQLFENVMKVLIGCKVVVVVVIAALLRPDLGEIASGLVPKVPAGSLLYAVGIIGGLGGTLALASYGYWVRDKGWRSRPGCRSCGWMLDLDTWSRPSSGCR